MVVEKRRSQTNAMGQLGCAGYVVGRLRRLCCGKVAQGMLWGNYSENNATLWPKLQAKTFHN